LVARGAGEDPLLCEASFDDALCSEADSRAAEEAAAGNATELASCPDAAVGRGGGEGDAACCLVLKVDCVEGADLGGSCCPSNSLRSWLVDLAGVMADWEALRAELPLWSAVFRGGSCWFDVGPKPFVEEEETMIGSVTGTGMRLLPLCEILDDLRPPSGIGACPCPWAAGGGDCIVVEAEEVCLRISLMEIGFEDRLEMLPFLGGAFCCCLLAAEALRGEEDAAAESSTLDWRSG
jgi:hypothetical protein